MKLDPSNKIVKLCAEGMAQEGAGAAANAKVLFQKAWEEAGTSLEKCVAAHYLARHQNSIKEKLEWDQTSLFFAKKMTAAEIDSFYPSIYLNIGKGYEDLKDNHSAKLNYELGYSYALTLPPEGYGRMIRDGLKDGLARVS